MNKSRFQEEMTDYLDGMADAVQVAELTQVIRTDADGRRLAIELCVLESDLEALMESAPNLLAPERLLTKARKRAMILGPSGLRLEAQDNDTLAAPLEAPKEPRGNGRATAAGKAGAAQARVRGTARRGAKLDPKRARRAGSSRALSYLMALAALVLVALVGVWVQRQKQKPGEPAIVESPKKSKGAIKANPIERKAEPDLKLPDDPIVEIAGGDFKREGNSISVDHRSVVDVVLSDGSKVRMQPHASVSFAQPNARNRQDLEVRQGKLEVQAAKDAKIFRIRLGNSELTVVGTRFVFDAPTREELFEGQPMPARIEVSEGAVLLRSPHGERNLEQGPQAILCDAFKPLLVPSLHDKAYAGFSGRLEGRILFKAPDRLLLRTMAAVPDDQNHLDGWSQMREQVVWLFVPPDRYEGVAEHSAHFLREVRVMKDLNLFVRSYEGRLIFTAKKWEREKADRDGGDRKAHDGERGGRDAWKKRADREDGGERPEADRKEKGDQERGKHERE